MVHNPSFPAALGYDAAGGTVYVSVGQVKDITAPAFAREDIDVTDHDSADGVREFLGGLVDGGVLTFTIGVDPTNVVHQQGTAGLLYGFTQTTCTMTTWELDCNPCSGTAIWTFGGYINGYTFNAPVSGELTADVSVKIADSPVFTTS